MNFIEVNWESHAILGVFRKSRIVTLNLVENKSKTGFFHDFIEKSLFYPILTLFKGKIDFPPFFDQIWHIFTRFWAALAYLSYSTSYWKSKTFF
jgi:hypothetical protein